MINYGNGTHHASLTSHYVREIGQIPSTSVHISTATTADFTNGVHHPRHDLATPSSEVFPPLVRLFLAPRYATVSSSSVHLCTNSCPRVVPNRNPVPHAQYGIKFETSGNAQEVKTAREMRAQARLVVPNSSSPNPVPHVRRGVEVEASEIRAARWLRVQAGRVVPNPSCPDPMPHDRFGVEDLEVEASELRTARCYGSKHDELSQIQIAKWANRAFPDFQIQSRAHVVESTRDSMRHRVEQGVYCQGFARRVCLHWYAAIFLVG
jgi:hypothetical protein